MERTEVLNAARTSNWQAPASGAAARELNEAARERRGAGLSTGRFTDEHRERAWTRVGMARDAREPGGMDRNVAREERLIRGDATGQTGAASRAPGLHGNDRYGAMDRVATDRARAGATSRPAPDATPARRRIVVSDASASAQNASRIAQAQAQASSASRGHSR